MVYDQCWKRTALIILISLKNLLRQWITLHDYVIIIIMFVFNLITMMLYNIFFYYYIGLEEETVLCSGRPSVVCTNTTCIILGYSIHVQQSCSNVVCLVYQVDGSQSCMCYTEC